MDTLPNRRYYRNGRRADGSYPCLECPYADNKTCSSCIFAKWNVEGIMAGFSPKEAYRQNHQGDVGASPLLQQISRQDRKSTRLNSSHVASSYAVFCLKKKMNK